MNLISRIKKILPALVALIVLLLIFFGYRHFHNSKSKLSNPNLNANDLQIETFKNSTNVGDMRVVLSAYEGKNDYKTALPLAEKIADQTKSYQDYMAVLNICALHDVSDKSGCITDVVNKLKPLIGQMPFGSAYAAGVLIEKSGNGKLAVDFYQRAYDTYAPDPKAENMLTKEQLKTKIDDLRK